MTATSTQQPQPLVPPGPAQATLVAFVNWLSAQLRRPSNPTRSVAAAVGALASLLREKPVRQLFTRNGALQDMDYLPGHMEFTSGFSGSQHCLLPEQSLL